LECRTKTFSPKESRTWALANSPSVAEFLTQAEGYMCFRQKFEQEHQQEKNALPINTKSQQRQEHKNHSKIGWGKSQSLRLLFDHSWKFWTDHVSAATDHFRQSDCPEDCDQDRVMVETGPAPMVSFSGTEHFPIC
jgi:hypothetical protein